MFLPDGPAKAAVLLLHGSSGVPPVHRARVLANRGYAVLAPQWFGAPGLPPCISEVPLEGFEVFLDELAELSLPLVVMGTSKGAEAGLLLATHRPDVDVVVALAPPAVVWEGLSSTNTAAGCSSWSVGGVPLTYVPLVEAEAGTPFATACEAHEAALRHRAAVEDAAVHTEDIRADVVLAAGGDDPVWPSVDATARLSRRRSEAGLATTVLVHPDAGHRVLLPGEPFVPADPSWPMGGTESVDRELGTAVLDALDRLLLVV